MSLSGVVHLPSGWSMEVADRVYTDRRTFADCAKQFPSGGMLFDASRLRILDLFCEGSIPNGPPADWSLAALSGLNVLYTGIFYSGIGAR